MSDEFYAGIRRRALEILGPEKTSLINGPGGINDLPYDKYVQRCNAVTELVKLEPLLIEEEHERLSLESREKFKRIFRHEHEYEAKKKRLLDLQLELAERELERKQRSKTYTASTTKRNFEKAVSNL